MCTAPSLQAKPSYCCNFNCVIGQLQVLATDEFWPTQGGKAPEISQVREALDAILSAASQKR
jgi:hypothetical protein